MPHDNMAEYQQKDMESITIYRNGLDTIYRYMLSRPDIFPSEKTDSSSLLSNSQREEAIHLWESIMDYYMALDSIEQDHRKFMKIKDKSLRFRSYCISRAALYTQYRYALDFIRTFENDTLFDVIFNESNGHYSMQKKMYKRFKTEYLNLVKASEFSAYEAVAVTFSNMPDTPLTPYIDEDRKHIWKTSVNDGASLTVKNGLNLINSARKDLFFPVQKRVSNWMGEVRVMPRSNNLIRPEQIVEMKQQLSPGDILLERREWALTNVGIPGFWTHAALYIGTPEERTAYFESDPEVQKWLMTEKMETLDHYIRLRTPIYDTALTQDKHGHDKTVIEAISPGVVFTSLEYSADCDSIAVLRPRTSKLAKAKAIAQAFTYIGKPYDYAFNFQSDEALVCTELVFKSYDAGNKNSAFQLPLTKTMGHLITPANEFAKQFSDHHKTDQQNMDLIFFLDGNEKNNTAVTASVDEFKDSWKRPKWHIVQQRFE